MSDDNLTQSQKAIYKLLCGLSRSSRSDFVNVAKGLLAKKIGASKRTVDAAIKKLIELKYIELIKSKGKLDGKSFNVYRVDFLPNDYYYNEYKLLKTKKAMSDSAAIAMSIAKLKSVGVDCAQLQSLVSAARAKKELAGIKPGSLLDYQTRKKHKINLHELTQ